MTGLLCKVIVDVTAMNRRPSSAAAMIQSQRTQEVMQSTRTSRQSYWQSSRQSMLDPDANSPNTAMRAIWWTQRTNALTGLFGVAMEIRNNA
jgi:hypothetical protein